MLSLAIILLTAFLLDFILGDPRSRLHPVALLGAWAMRIEHFCRKLMGGSVIAGFAAWFAVLASAVVPAYFVTWVARHWGGELTGALTAGVWLYICIAPRSLWQHAERIRRPLATGDLPDARKALSMIVSRDTANLSESEIARGAAESLGENLVDAVNSAVFWAVIGGLIGGTPLAAALAALLRAANTLDACWGYQNERYLYFGRIAAKADDALHYIPARLSPVAISLGALLVKGDPPAALRYGFKHRHDHPSPNSAWGMAAFAGTLGIRLGGPTVYNGQTEDNPYLGTGRTVLNAADIRRAQWLCILSAVIFAFFMLLGAYVAMLIAVKMA